MTMSVAWSRGCTGRIGPSNLRARPKPSAQEGHASGAPVCYARSVTWFEYIEAKLAADIDQTLIDRQLALTPTERLEQLEQMMALLREVRKPRVQAADRSAR